VFITSSQGRDDGGDAMTSLERQAELRDAMNVADSISRLEGYTPDAFEEQQKTRVVAGEITTGEFLRIMREHFAGLGHQK